MRVTVARWTVRLSVEMSSDLMGQPLTVTATAEGGSPRVVRGWREVPTPGTVILIDHEAELNRPVRYALLVRGVEVGSVTVTVPAETPILTDPVRGLHIPVTIQEWPERRTSRAGHVLEIPGRFYPVIIDGVEQEASSSITLIHCHSDSSAQQLDDLLGSQSVLRIRPSCADLPTLWVSARDRRRRRFSTRPGSAQVDELEVRHIDQPWPDTAAVGNTLGDLDRYMAGILARAGTLGDVAAQWPGTLGDIAYEDLSS